MSTGKHEAGSDAHARTYENGFAEGNKQGIHLGKIEGKAYAAGILEAIAEETDEKVELMTHTAEVLHALSGQLMKDEGEGQEWWRP